MTGGVFGMAHVSSGIVACGERHFALRDYDNVRVLYLNVKYEKTEAAKSRHLARRA
jgi:hypothetical protein